MSFAFRRHGYNLDEFERCEEHGCVVMQVTVQAQPRCLVDWLTERAGRRRVVDVIPRERSRRFVPQEEYNAAGLVLEGGFLLPVEQAVEVAAGQWDAEVNLSLTGWWVADILYVRGEEGEGVMVELLPPGARVDEEPGVLLRLHLDILLYLLEDEEIRRYEP